MRSRSRTVRSIRSIHDLDSKTSHLCSAQADRKLQAHPVLATASRSRKYFPMKTSLSFIAAAVFLFAAMPFSRGAQPAPNTEWDGVIAALNAASVAVQSPKGTKVFAIYPGTVFGQRASKKISDFKVGDKVKVVFSSVGTQTKAENIRNPDDDKKPGAKKAKAAAKK